MLCVLQTTSQVLRRETWFQVGALAFLAPIREGAPWGKTVGISRRKIQDDHGKMRFSSLGIIFKNSCMTSLQAATVFLKLKTGLRSSFSMDQFRIQVKWRKCWVYFKDIFLMWRTYEIRNLHLIIGYVHIEKQLCTH